GNHAPLRGYWQCGKQRHSTNPPPPLPVGERPTSRASEMSGEGSCCPDLAPHPVCSLRSQTTLSPTERGSVKLPHSQVTHAAFAASRRDSGSGPAPGKCGPAG